MLHKHFLSFSLSPSLSRCVRACVLRQCELGWGRVGGDKAFPQAPDEASWLVVCTYLIAHATVFFFPVLFPLCWIEHVYSKQ